MLAFLLTLGLLSTAVAQSDEPAEAEIYELQAFIINTDYDSGYVAVDSLAGGRINTPVKFTPSSISSLTDAFIEDLGIQNVREALRWAPNVVPASPDAGKGFGGSAFHDWSFNYRGSGAGQQGGPGPTRNYFSFYQNADSYNIERIEFLRGPNSLIFGLGTVGGSLSIYTKVPRADKDFFIPTVTVDNNGSSRFEIDYNRRLSDTVSIRMNAVVDKNRGWRKNDENDLNAVTLAIQWRPTVDTTLRVEGEYASIERTLIGSSLTDKFSGWDGMTASQSWGAAPTGDANTVPIQNAGAWGDWLNEFWVFIPGLGENSLMPWAGGYASTNAMEDTGNGLQLAPYAGFYPSEIKLPWHTEYSSTTNVPVMPSRDWTYGNGKLDITYKTVTAFLDHRFNENMEASVSVYRYEDDNTAKNYEATGGAAVDINKELPNGAINPNYGKTFADFFLSKQLQSRSVDEVRAQINYHFERTLFGQSWEQLFSASAAMKEVNITARQNLGQIGDSATLSNPADWVQNMIWARIYLDDPNPVLNIPKVAPNGQMITYSPKADGYWFDFDDEFKLKDYAFMSHSKLFDSRLSILAGVRIDSYEEDVRELRRGANLSDLYSSENESGTTYSMGAVYYFGWLGVFANYSENIQPPNPGSQPMLSGNRPSPEQGKGLDYGIRISTGDGKYYATLSRYDTKSEGHLVENPVGLRGIWQRYYDAQPALTRAPDQDGLAYSDSTSRDVSGYEFEITANPTNSIRLQASYAIPDTKIVDYYPDSRAYFSENLATWNQGIAVAETELSAENLRSAIAGVQNALDQAVSGAKESGVVKYTASLFVHYTFPEDLIKGFSMGAGFSRTGRAYAGIYDGEEYYSSDVTNTNAMIAWETTVRGIPTRFAVNVDNLLGEEDPIVTGYHWGYTGRDGKHVGTEFYLPAPRTVRFTARFTF